ncbi:hypothetical protein SAMN04488514_115129, partial [Kriegella aquimaris]
DLGTLVNDADFDITNEIQDLSLTGDILTITNNAGATDIDLGGYINTDEQQISLSGNTITFANGTGADTTVDLTGFINTDEQDLTGAVLTGNSLEISIQNGDPVTVDLGTLVNDADSNPSNEIQVLGRTGTNVTLTNGGGSVSIADNDNDSGNEIQTLDSADGSVTLTNTSNNYDLSVNFPANNDNSATNELTDLDLSSDILTLTNPATPTNQVDLSPYLDNTDNQVASEVNSDTPVDVDGDGNTEATVEDVIQDIAPITSKAARIFYPPSIAVDASTVVNNVTIDLYQEYIDQFGSPTMASAGAPSAIPTYTKTELYYYVTYVDPAVLNIDSISADGVMQYDVVGTPADYNSLINVVFVVK